MDQITIKTPNPKCRLYWCLICRVYRLENGDTVSHVGIFDPSYKLPSLQFTPPPPSPLRLCGEHIHVQEYVYLTRFRTYKIVPPPQTKTWEGRGPQIDKQLPPSTFTGKFLRKADI